MRGCRRKREDAGGRSLSAASLRLRCSLDSCRALSLRGRLVEVAPWDGRTVRRRAPSPLGRYSPRGPSSTCSARHAHWLSAKPRSLIAGFPLRKTGCSCRCCFPNGHAAMWVTRGSVLSPVFILKHIDVIDDCGEDVQNNECECPGLLCARRQVVVVDHCPEHPNPKCYQRQDENEWKELNRGKCPMWGKHPLLLVVVQSSRQEWLLVR